MDTTTIKQIITNLELSASVKQQLLTLVGNEATVSEETMQQVLTILDKYGNEMEQAAAEAEAQMRQLAKAVKQDPKATADFKELYTERKAIEQEAQAQIEAAYQEFDKEMATIDHKVQQAYKQGSAELDKMEMATVQTNIANS
jgi:hypothetical protein